MTRLEYWTPNRRIKWATLGQLICAFSLLEILWIMADGFQGPLTVVFPMFILTIGGAIFGIITFLSACFSEWPGQRR